jgi:hypothetical protein
LEERFKTFSLARLPLLRRNLACQLITAQIQIKKVNKLENVPMNLPSHPPSIRSLLIRQVQFSGKSGKLPLILLSAMTKQIILFSGNRVGILPFIELLVRFSVLLLGGILSKIFEASWLMLF